MGGVLVALQALMSYKRARALEDTARAQVEASNAQAIANRNVEQGQRQERMKNAIEHLGSASASVRLGGAYELFHLADDIPDFRQSVLDILCAHIRQVTGQTEYQEEFEESPSEEVQSVLTLLFVQESPIFSGYGINLKRSWLRGADLSGAYLQRSDLQEVQLHRATLSGAQLQDANLYKARMQGAYLVSAELSEHSCMKHSCRAQISEKPVCLRLYSPGRSCRVRILLSYSFRDLYSVIRRCMKLISTRQDSKEYVVMMISGRLRNS